MIERWSPRSTLPRDRSQPPVVRIASDANGDLKDQRIYIFQVQKVGDELQFVQVQQ